MHLFDSYSFDWRPQYPSLESYAQDLCAVWTQFVDANDIVIIVGDIGTNCKFTVNLLKSLPGKKVLVKGNHDLIWGKNLWSCGVFQGIYDEIVDGNVYVKHIPDTVVTNKYFVHGHHHLYTTPNMGKELKLYAADTYRLNCCADLVHNKPMTLQELIINKEVYIDEYRRSIKNE